MASPSNKEKARVLTEFLGYNEWLWEWGDGNLDTCLQFNNKLFYEVDPESCFRSQDHSRRRSDSRSPVASLADSHEVHTGAVS